MLEPTSDKHYEEKFEFPLMKVRMPHSELKWEIPIDTPEVIWYYGIKYPIARLQWVSNFLNEFVCDTR